MFVEKRVMQGAKWMNRGRLGAEKRKTNKFVAEK